MKKNDVLALATKKSEEVIRVEFTPAQIAEKKDEVSSSLMRQLDLEETLKDIKAEYKEKLDSIKKNIRTNLRSIRNGFTDVTMNVLNVPNEEELTIEFYDEETASKVGERKMTSTEKPSITFPISKVV